MTAASSAVSHEGVELARGIGRSKKLAESAAALAALQHLKLPKETVRRHP
jgi:dsRNA-specific ribonuclease